MDKFKNDPYFWYYVLFLAGILAWPFLKLVAIVIDKAWNFARDMITNDVYWKGFKNTQREIGHFKWQIADSIDWVVKDEHNMRALIHKNGTQVTYAEGDPEYQLKKKSEEWKRWPPGDYKGYW